MKYDWILFDADETLYSFHSYDGLKPMLARYGIDFTQEDYAAFQAVNQPLWIAYQNKTITAETLQRTACAHQKYLWRYVRTKMMECGRGSLVTHSRLQSYSWPCALTQAHGCDSALPKAP